MCSIDIGKLKTSSGESPVLSLRRITKDHTTAFNGTTPFPLNEINPPFPNGFYEAEVTKEQLRKEYWPFLEPQQLLSKLLIQGSREVKNHA